MLDEAKTKKEQSVDLALLSGLTRRQLKELEEKEKTPAQKAAEAVIMVLPLLCGGIALLEYLLVPNNSRNRNPWSYVWALGAALAVYLVCLLAAVWQKKKGKRQFYDTLHYKAPHFPRLLIRKHKKVSKINVFKGREHGTKSKNLILTGTKGADFSHQRPFPVPTP